MSKEIQQIISKVNDLAAGTEAVLATVVDVRGSGYRLPGARMLMLSDGETFGTVSGGCLEADVLERAKKVLETGRSEVFKYDTTADENSVFSMNMGCRGVMRILIEPVGKNAGIIAKLYEVNKKRHPLVAAVVVNAGHTSLAIGERVYFGEANDADFDDPHLLLETAPQLRDDLFTFGGSTSTFETIEYEVDGEIVEFAFETLRPPVQLLILGAGADAVPLAVIAHEIGWQVRVYDHRPAFLTKERFPNADELVMLNRDAKAAVEADNLTAIVAMNHNYDRDKALIAAALHTDAFYLGALGPKKRTSQILDELKERGEQFEPSQMTKLRSPAGLDIGGDSPETIAVSIIAEIQSVLKHRNGGPLLAREAPIYDRK
ncbi:MAG TPA: XdhC/CoxI family protein [Pyrinomonadaceae bacterium]|nr:XdhC/CoxI family protein [Pyrinomonadaceae bacterium]